MRNADHHASPQLFQQGCMVSALSLEMLGHIDHPPGNSGSCVGPYDTGYSNHIASAASLNIIG